MNALKARAAAPSDMRQHILDRASEVIAEDGPEGLSMRRLSQRIGASTIVLYTHFRDKQAILDELYVEGFARLTADLEAVRVDADPVIHVMNLGRAYRASAVRNPTYYQLMFTRCVPGFDPAPESRAAARQAFAVLAAAVQRCLDAGLLVDGDASHVAHTLWGTLHGLISLELFGYLPPKISGAQRLEHALTVIRDGLLAAHRPEASS